MKIKSSTWILALAALLLGGISLIVMQQPAPNRASQSGETVTSEEERQIFEFAEGDVQAFTLTTPLRTLQFERNPNGKWQMLEPEKTAASEPSVAFLLDLVATSKTPRTLTVPAADRQQYGLHQPLATIDLTLKDQTKHQLIIGEYDFNRSFLYAQANPLAPDQQPEQINVLLLSPNFESAVSRPLAEWKQPTAAEKASPSPSPSPNVSPNLDPEENVNENSDAESEP
jgi:hypothetical protein